MEDDLPNDIDELKRLVREAVKAKGAAETELAEAVKAKEAAETELTELRYRQYRHWMEERNALIQNSMPCGMTWKLTRTRW